MKLFKIFSLRKHLVVSTGLELELEFEPNSHVFPIQAPQPCQYNNATFQSFLFSYFLFEFFLN